ncbi:hypothetical protein ACFY1L_43225 [Streptomyces sp. NPDC001663]|uniref:hypothetical protein n=1 Tax=Streptomyces sp. NPDC001663 TaxID=3364597 RepID=UPI0036AEFA14
MIRTSGSRHPVLWGTVLALSAALGGQTLMSTPAAANRLLDEPTAVPGYTLVEKSSPLSSDSARSVSARCPSGKVVLAGGASIVGGGQKVLLRGSYPGHAASGHKWSAKAEEVHPGTPARWYIRAYAVCADKPARLTYQRVDSFSDSAGRKSVRVDCPDDTQLIGLGARLKDGNHRTGINAVTVRSDHSASARAGESKPTSLSWSLAAHAVCAKPLEQSFHESERKFVAGAAQSQTAAAKCPLGSRAYGTGLRLFGGSATLNRLVPVELRPTRIPPVPAEGRVTVSELAPGTPATWAFKAQVICVR